MIAVTELADVAANPDADAELEFMPNSGSQTHHARTEAADLDRASGAA